MSRSEFEIKDLAQESPETIPQGPWGGVNFGLPTQANTQLMVRVYNQGPGLIGRAGEFFTAGRI